MQKMVAFEALEFDDILKGTVNDVSDSESVDIHFEAMGYESSDSILNLGFIFVIMVCAPLLLLLLKLMSLCFCKRLKACT